VSGAPSAPVTSYTFDRVRETISAMAVSRKLLTEGEEVVLSVRTHVKALFLPILILVVACAAAGFLYAVSPDNEAGKWLKIVILAAAALVIIVWSLAPFIRWLTSTYTVTSRRLIFQTGILTRSGRVIPLHRINDVSFEKHLSDRIFGCGTLIIHDASEQSGLRLPDIPRIETIHRTITDLVFELHGGTDDDGTPERRST
jgi:membrane protein YdbS with pleckstrin-like domain